jgi:hypothetical protein
VLQIDHDTQFSDFKRIITVDTATRVVQFRTYTTAEAIDWKNALQECYKQTGRRLHQEFGSFAPPREMTEVKMYTCSKDYFASGKSIPNMLAAI